jgi:hypothetical protein
MRDVRDTLRRTVLVLRRSVIVPDQAILVVTDLLANN